MAKATSAGSLVVGLRLTPESKTKDIVNIKFDYFNILSEARHPGKKIYLLGKELLPKAIIAKSSIGIRNKPKQFNQKSKENSKTQLRSKRVTCSEKTSSRRKINFQKKNSFLMNTVSRVTKTPSAETPSTTESHSALTRPLPARTQMTYSARCSSSCAIQTSPTGSPR